MHPDNPAAQDLRTRTISLIQFLLQLGIVPDKRLENAVLHAHCHDKSTDIAEQERQWLNQCFTHITEPEEGCCGMAGTYGIQKKTAAIGRRLFNRALGPAIEESEQQAYVVSNGYSCRSQISSKSSRRAYHSVEIIDMCL